MKTLPFKQLETDPKGAEEVARVLTSGGLVCLPCGGNYRLMADLYSEEAVSRLVQSKRRIHKAPALVFVSDVSMLQQVTGQVPDRALPLMKKFWPGPLTILFDAHPDLPPKVIRLLTKANGKLGVRIPEDKACQMVVRAAGRPVLVSSANVESKRGSSSPAQVRKNFLGRVDLFVDAGDLQPCQASTVVDVDDQCIRITRIGAIPADKLEDHKHS